MNSMIMGPIQSILAGGLEIPHFQGTKSEWHQYEREVEDMFLAAANINGTPLNDSQKLALLELTLDPVSKKRLKADRNSGRG